MRNEASRISAERDREADVEDLKRKLARLTAQLDTE